MQQFEHTVKAENGIHARPAGLFAKENARFESEITVALKNGKSSSAKKLFALMQLGVKKDDQIVVTADGPDETEAIAAAAEFVKRHF